MNTFVPMRKFETLTVVWVFLAFCGLALTSSISLGGSQYLITIGFILYTIVSMMALLTGARYGWFHPLVFSVVWGGLVQFTLPKLGILVTGLDYHALMGDTDQEGRNLVAALSFMLAALGVLGFLVGFLISRPSRLTIVAKARPPSAMVLKVGAVVAISFFSMLLLAQEAGGIGRLLLERGVPREDRVSELLGGRHWHFLVRLGPTACLVWLALVPRVWKSPLFLTLFAASLAIGFVATGSRSAVVVPVLVAATTCCLAYQRIPYMLVAAMFAFGVFVVGVGGEFRMASRSATDVDTIEVAGSVPEKIVEGVNVLISRGSQSDGFLGIVHRVPEEVGYLYGYSYLSVLYAPVPAVVLPFKKPEAGGKLTAFRIFHIPVGAVPPGPIGEAYWNFGVPGVFVIMLIFGKFMRFLSSVYANSPRNGFITITYVAALFYLNPATESIYAFLHFVVPAFFLSFLFSGVPRLVHRSPRVAQ